MAKKQGISKTKKSSQIRNSQFEIRNSPRGSKSREIAKLKTVHSETGLLLFRDGKDEYLI